MAQLPQGRFFSQAFSAALNAPWESNPTPQDDPMYVYMYNDPRYDPMCMRCSRCGGSLFQMWGEFVVWGVGFDPPGTVYLGTPAYVAVPLLRARY